MEHHVDPYLEGFTKLQLEGSIETTETIFRTASRVDVFSLIKMRAYTWLRGLFIQLEYAETQVV